MTNCSTRTGGRTSARHCPTIDLGHPDPEAFAALVHACTTGDQDDFAAIPLGGVQPLRNPQAGLSFEVCGYDSNQTIVPPAPAFASAWRAGEMVEVYWAALLRDVPFTEYGTHPLVAQACRDLSRLSDFRGPKDGGLVTPHTIFRAPYAGAVDGPFISQFLLKDIAFGAQLNTQQVRVFVPGVDYLTTYADWLARQNGAPWDDRLYDATFRYMRNGRDLAAWVDADPPLQAAYHALSILLQMGAPLDPANPYVNQITNQDAFTTFGPVEWFDLIGRAPRPAHEAVWFQKWRIHRSLRPEEYGGRVHNHLTARLCLSPACGRAGVPGRSGDLQPLWHLPVPAGVSRRGADALRLSVWPLRGRRRDDHDAQGDLRRALRDPEPGGAERGRPAPPALRGPAADRRRRAQQTGLQHRHGAGHGRDPLAQRRHRGEQARPGGRDLHPAGHAAGVQRAVQRLHADEVRRHDVPGLTCP